MPKLTFPYETHLVRSNEAFPLGRLALRPIVTIKITSRQRRQVRFAALLDSGADTCLFPTSVALLLGLDLTKMPQAHTGGVGTTRNITYYDHVTLELGLGATFEAYVGFTAGLDGVGLGLLGQYGFFDQHKVDFRHGDGTFTIEAH